MRAKIRFWQILKCPLDPFFYEHVQIFYAYFYEFYVSTTEILRLSIKKCYGDNFTPIDTNCTPFDKNFTPLGRHCMPTDMSYTS